MQYELIRTLVPYERRARAVAAIYEPITDESPGVIEEGKFGPCPRANLDGKKMCPFGVAYTDRLVERYGDHVGVLQPGVEMIVNVIMGADVGDGGGAGDTLPLWNEVSDFTDTWDAGLIEDLAAALGVEKQEG